MSWGTLLLVALAPLPFWLLGLAWLVGEEPRRVTWAPLVGCALAGFYAELAMVVGAPVQATVGALVVASGAVATYRARSGARRREAWAACRAWLPIYLVAVLAAALSPFPVLGAWSGDWWFLYHMGESVAGGALTPDQLARPPLFGAATTPLWIVVSGFVPYQLMSAVASASAVTTTGALIERFFPGSRRRLLLPLLLSPFFLHHGAAAWGKMLAAGLVLAALLEAWSACSWISAALFALAVGVHEGAIVWAPCVLLAQLGPAARGRAWRFAAGVAARMAVCGLAVLGPLNVWIALKYGLAAKVAENPAFNEPVRESFGVKTILTIVTTFVGWGPPLSLERWLRQDHPASMAVVNKEAYWLITSWITTMAGTVLGVLFVWLAVWKTAAPGPWPGELADRRRVWSVSIGVAIAIIASAALAPFHSNEGTMQNALVPLALAAYALLAGHIGGGARSAVAVRRAAWLMGLFGALPWVLINVGTSWGLRFSGGFRERFRAGSEGDYLRVLDHQLRTLGLTAFPQVPLACAVALGVWALATHRRGSSQPGELTGRERRASSIEEGT